MVQQTFTDMEYANRKRTTRREAFLDAMESIIPWNEWMALIAPYYVQKERGRKLIPLETMLRMYLMQNWFGLSDEGIEDAIYDSYAMKRFLKIDFSTEQTPDATTLLHFRHLLEKHDIARKMFDDVKQRLDASGLIMHGGTIVDATIIHAPSSTKNATKSRDPEMHSAKKGNQWYFGMKIHSGADAASGYVHTITATAANVHDITQTHALIREDDHSVYGDSGYLGVEKRAEIREDSHLSSVDYRIAKKPSQNRMTKEYKGTNWDRVIEHAKASVRSKVEHPFLIVKRLFHAGRTRYRGLRKNLLQYYLLFASANLVMCLRAGRHREFCMTTG